MSMVTVEIRCVPFETHILFMQPSQNNIFNSVFIILFLNSLNKAKSTLTIPLKPTYGVMQVKKEKQFVNI